MTRILPLILLLTYSFAQEPRANRPHSGSVFKDGKWSEKQNPMYAFELHRAKSAKSKYVVKTIPAVIYFDKMKWKVDSSKAAEGVVSFTPNGEKMTVVSVKVRKGYLSKEEIRKWLLEFYTTVYGKSQNKIVNLDYINGKEFNSYFFVNEYKGSHIIAYDMVHSDIQETLVITTICPGTEHLRLYQPLMEFVSGIEANNSL